MQRLELISERNRKGLSQKKIAKELNLSVVQYGKKERGTVDFTISEVKLMKKILNLDVKRIYEIFLS